MYQADARTHRSASLQRDTLPSVRSSRRGESRTIQFCFWRISVNAIAALLVVEFNQKGWAIGNPAIFPVSALASRGQDEGWATRAEGEVSASRAGEVSASHDEGEGFLPGSGPALASE
jgi:hypothetical protein